MAQIAVGGWFDQRDLPLEELVEPRGVGRRGQLKAAMTGQYVRDHVRIDAADDQPRISDTLELVILQMLHDPGMQHALDLLVRQRRIQHLSAERGFQGLHSGAREDRRRQAQAEGISRRVSATILC